MSWNLYQPFVMCFLFSSLSQVHVGCEKKNNILCLYSRDQGRKLIFLTLNFTSSMISFFHTCKWQRERLIHLEFRMIYHPNREPMPNTWRLEWEMCCFATMSSAVSPPFRINISWTAKLFEGIKMWPRWHQSTRLLSKHVHGRWFTIKWRMWNTNWA